VALSPILGIAWLSRSANAALLLPLLGLVWLLTECEASGRRGVAAAAGVAAGALAASGALAFAAVAAGALVWLALRPERRPQAWLAAAGALAALAALAVTGHARSPVDFGSAAATMPRTTLESLVRCSGASLTRVIGLEYQLVVAHARFVLPMTLLFVALMAKGATELPRRAAGLLLAGASAPFALAALLAALTGSVAPLQADRLLAALPFSSRLLAAGLASLRGWGAWAAGAAVVASLAGFLSLALLR
jgi:hypothetical protein